MAHKSSSAAAARVPRLQLDNIETGGGWGLGDKFARLPPAHLQAKEGNGIYKVASTQARPAAQRQSPDELARQSQQLSSSLEAVPETRYEVQPEDDDNTFVDHGCGASMSNAAAPAPSYATAAPLRSGDSAAVPATSADVERGQLSVATPQPAVSRSQLDALYASNTLSRDSGAGRSPMVGLSLASQAGRPAQRRTLAPPSRLTYRAVEKTRDGTGPPPPLGADLARWERTAAAGLAAQSEDVTSHHDSVTRPSRSGVPPWNPPRLVSRMATTQATRDMVVTPDGRYLCIAVGDDPLTMLELDGTDLTMSHSVDSVTQVACIAVVRVPQARQVTFTSLDKAPGLSRGLARRTPQLLDAHEPAEPGGDSYVLWCGLSRGNIAIVDLQRGTDDGCIRAAHAQTVNRIWYLENGKVWSAGRDKAVKVWDPLTRRRVKNRNIAAILTDLCYVRETDQVWAIADDSFIRVYNAGGDNVRVLKQAHDKAENAVKMRYDVQLVRYNADANVVWAGMSRGTALMDPRTYEVARTVNITLTSLAFHKKTAVVTGHGPMMETEQDCVALLDITSPLEPSLLFLGAPMDGVSPIGVRLFPSVPLAVVAQEEGKQRRKILSVFTYEETQPFGKLASAPRNSQALAPQWKEAVRSKTAGSKTSAPGGSPSPGRALTPFTAVPVSNERSRAASPVSVSGERYVTPSREVEELASGVMAVAAPPQASSVSAYGHRPAMQSSRVELPPNYRGGVAAVGGAAGAAPAAAAAVVTSPEILNSLSMLDKKTQEIMSVLSSDKRAVPPLADFVKLYSELAAIVAGEQSEAALPTLDAEENEAVDKEYVTAEGKVMALIIKRLQKALHRRRSTQASCSPRHSSVQDASRGAANGFLPPRASFNPSDVATEGRPSTAGALSELPTEGNSEALLRWMAQITRSGQQEREAHQRQLLSLQRHNRRIFECNVAFVNGTASLQETLRSHAQRIASEADTSMLESSPFNDGPARVGRPRTQLVTVLNEYIWQMQEVTSRSSPREISECAAMMADLVGRLLSAQQALLSPSSADNAKPLVAPGERGSRGQRRLRTAEEHQSRVAAELELQQPRRSQASPTGSPTSLASAEGLDRGAQRRTGDDDDARAAAAAGATAAAEVLSTGVPVSPRRLLAFLKDGIDDGEGLVARFGAAWSRVEDTCKVMYVPYRDGRRPNLRHDFMQSASVVNLVEAQMMLDMCRMEACVVVMEGLLDVKPGAYLNPCGDEQQQQLGCEEPAPNYLPAEEQRRVLERAAAESARLVAVSIETEALGSRVRHSLEHLRGAVPADVDAAEAKGFLAMQPPPQVRQCRLGGMLYWAHVCMRLLVECLEAVEGLLYAPPAENSITLETDNFLVITQKLSDWRSYLEERQRSATALHSVLTQLQREDVDAIATAASLPPDGSASPWAWASGNALAAQRSGTTAAQRLPALEEDHTSSSRDAIQNFLIRLYTHAAAQAGTYPLLLLSCEDAARKQAEPLADYSITSSLEDLIDTLDTLNAKITPLLRYCQALQLRASQVMEENIGFDEAGCVVVSTGRLVGTARAAVIESTIKDFCREI